MVQVINILLQFKSTEFTIQSIFYSLFLYFPDAEKLVGLDSDAQNLVNCLQVLEILTPALHVELLSKVHEET